MLSSYFFSYVRNTDFSCAYVCVYGNGYGYPQTGHDLGQQMARVKKMSDFSWLVFCVVRHVKTLKRNRYLFIPGGWSTTAKNHGVVYLLRRCDTSGSRKQHRLADRSIVKVPDDDRCEVDAEFDDPKQAQPRTYSFIVCNTGEGVEYHRSSARAHPKMKYETTVRFDGIPAARMCDEAFW